MTRSLSGDTSLAGWLLVVAAATAALGQESPSAGHHAALERLPASPLLLQVPAGLTGDFDVAATQPEIDFALFPNQWAGARLWSSWGDALSAADGSFYASIGDHGAPHGTSYVYRIDPVERTILLVVDFNATIGIADASRYTPGKIHGGLVEAGDRGILFFGYRGSERQTTAAVGYRGDWLLSYDPATDRAESLGIPLADCSVPVLLHHAASRSLYGLSAPGQTAVDPRSRFFRYRLDEGEVAFHGGPEPNVARALILADDGRAWYSHGNAAGEDMLVRYDPDTNQVVATAARVPQSGQLRAASRPDGDGVAWCVTQDGTLFSFDTRDEAIRELGPAFTAPPLYTATCRLDQSGRYLYYLPGAHGGTRDSGTPLVQYDTRGGHRKVIAFLDAYLRETADYAPGGTYGIALSPDGGRLFVGLNGAAPDAEQQDFGLCAAVVVHIPPDERATD